jgi:hypothetical protein
MDSVGYPEGTRQNPVPTILPLYVSVQWGNGRSLTRRCTMHFGKRLDRTVFRNFRWRIISERVCRPLTKTIPT